MHSRVLHLRADGFLLDMTGVSVIIFQYYISDTLLRIVTIACLYVHIVGVQQATPYGIPWGFG